MIETKAAAKGLRATQHHLEKALQEMCQVYGEKNTTTTTHNPYNERRQAEERTASDCGEEVLANVRKRL